jgi:L-rhamnose-H+ transport protein
LSFNALIFLVAGLLILIFGVAQVAASGKLREKDQQKDENAGSVRKVSFKVGLLVCIIASIFCPASNFAVFFGQPISEAVKELGAVAPYNVGYAQLLPYFIGGFIVNTIYCAYLFLRNKSFKNYYSSGIIKNILLGVSMSGFFIVGMVLYTIALTIYIKDIGAVVGWPLFMAATIMVANILGLISGEWKNVTHKAFVKLYSGIGLLIIAIILVSLSNLFR